MGDKSKMLNKIFHICTYYSVVRAPGEEEQNLSSRFHSIRGRFALPPRRLTKVRLAIAFGWNGRGKGNSLWKCIFWIKLNSRKDILQLKLFPIKRRERAISMQQTRWSSYFTIQHLIVPGIWFTLLWGCFPCLSFLMHARWLYGIYCYTMWCTYLELKWDINLSKLIDSTTYLSCHTYIYQNRNIKCMPQKCRAQHYSGWTNVEAEHCSGRVISLCNRLQM